MAWEKQKQRKVDIAEVTALAQDVEVAVSKLWRSLLGPKVNPGLRALDDIFSQGEKEDLYEHIAHARDYLEEIGEIVFEAETLEMLEEIRQGPGGR